MDDLRHEPAGDRMIALLRRQQSLYRQLRRLADRQKALVVEDETEALLGLLADRQKLVDELVRSNESLSPYRANWTRFYSGLNEAQRKETAQLLEEVNSSLSAILKDDKRDTATLTAKRQSMAEQLTTLETGGRVSAAYTNSPAGSGGRLADARA